MTESPPLLSRLLPALVNGVKMLVTGIAALVMAIVAAVSTIVGVVAKVVAEVLAQVTGLVREALPFLLSLVPVLARGALVLATGASMVVAYPYLWDGYTGDTGSVIVGGVIGFYDGFFGPGTGSFLIFLFIRFFGFDFLHASAAAKIVNVATNLAAIAYFAPNGYYLPVLAVVMAIGNVGGSFLGTHLALRHGSGFVRKVFLIVVSALIVKFAWDTF